jgi:hypothetical protein
MAAFFIFVLLGIHAPGRHAMPHTQSSGQAQLPRKVVLETIECAPKKPPAPPKPPPPKDGLWVPFDVQDALLHDSITDGVDASRFYVAVSLPSFVTLTANPAALDFAVTLGNGATVTSTHPLVRDGSGYRLLNPGAVDYWMLTAAQGGVATRLGVSGIEIQGTQPGSASLGVAQYFGSNPMNAFSAPVTQPVPNGGSTRIVKY